MKIKFTNQRSAQQFIGDNNLVIDGDKFTGGLMGFYSEEKGSYIFDVRGEK